MSQNIVIRCINSPWSHISDMSRIVAKKIVSWLKSSLSSLPFFRKRSGTRFLSPFFCKAWDVGLPSFAFTRWQMQFMDTLYKCSKQNFISISLFIIVAPILKVVRNLFKTFHLDGWTWFRY